MIRLGNASPEFKQSHERDLRTHNAYCWCAFTKRFGDWYLATKTFDVLPGETHAFVMLKCDNAQIEIRDAVLCEEVEQPAAEAKTQEGPMTIRAEFCNYVGGTFEVSQGQPGELAFTFKRRSGETYDATKGEFSMTLPKGIEFVDASFAKTGTIAIATNADGSTTARFRPRPGIPVDLRAPWWISEYVIVRATGGQGECGEGWLSYRLDDGKSKFTAESMRIRFSISSTIAGSQPKRFACGGWPLNGYAFADKSSVETLAKFHRDCGQNWIIPDAAKEYPNLKIWRDCGFSTITPQTGFWCRNGYNLGDRNIPADEKFTWVDETAKKRYGKSWGEGAVCPSAVAERTDYMKNVVMKRIARYAQGVDGLWANWEPYGFMGNGCACPRCGKAFAACMGMDWSAVSNSWPKCAFPGGKYAKEGSKFRSRLHGNVIRAIDAAVRSSTGADSVGFVPGVHFGTMSSSWREKSLLLDASPIDYAADLKWINLWGPYVPWRVSQTPYPRERARHIAHFVCARDTREQIEKDYPSAEKRPRILASPQGTSGDYFSQPEAFEMAFDAYIFNGYGGCCPWVFPMGADARYWRAFANASRRAALYEDIVYAGHAADESVSVETVPEYAAPVERVTKYMDKWRNVPQIFSASYDNVGGRVVAVFNCWQKGEAFFTLKTTGLAPGKYAISSHDGILWAKDRRMPSYTAEELAEGVFLSVGACRTRVFEIMPEGSSPRVAPTSIMTAENLRKAYSERKEALRIAARQDAKDAEEDISGVSMIE